MTWVGGRDPIWISIKDQDNNLWFASTTAPPTGDRYIFVEGDNCAHFKYVPEPVWSLSIEHPEPLEEVLCCDKSLVGALPGWAAYWIGYWDELGEVWLDTKGTDRQPTHWMRIPKVVP